MREYSIEIDRVPQPPHMCDTVERARQERTPWLARELKDQVSQVAVSPVRGPGVAVVVVSFSTPIQL